MRRQWPWMALALGLSACGGSGGGSAGGNPPGDPQLVEAFPQLATLSRLVYLAVAPGDTVNLYAVTQGGRILRFANRADVSGEPAVFLDISAAVRTEGEQGLLGLAFHPQYASNRLFYVYYSPAGGARRTRLSRFTANAAGSGVVPGSEAPLLEIAQPDFSNHKGGGLQFGADGMLYVAVGDGGGSGDPGNNAQNLASLLGKILRLTPEGGIPPGNPFVGSSGARGEIWAWGFRNPWRISFDGATLWAADVGQNTLEEIDVVQAGGNYGWRVFEGSQRFNSGDPVPAGHVLPVFQYGHGGGNCSITGGYVYRGAALAATLAGRYIYADFCSGAVWALRVNGSDTQNEQIGALGESPTSFGRDHAGELYLTTLEGNIYKLQP